MTKREKKGHKEHPPKVTIAQVADALQKSSGITAKAARYIEQVYGVSYSRQALFKRVENSERLQLIREEARENTLDNCEDVLQAEIEGGNWRVALAVLKMLGKTRGYTERQEVTGMNGGPVEVEQTYNFEALSREELETLEKILSKAAGEEQKNKEE